MANPIKIKNSLTKSNMYKDVWKVRGAEKHTVPYGTSDSFIIHFLYKGKVPFYLVFDRDETQKRFADVRLVSKLGNKRVYGHWGRYAFSMKELTNRLRAMNL